MLVIDTEVSGIYAWGKAGLDTASIPQMPVDEPHRRIEEQPELQIVDVRRPAEYASGHIPGAINFELSHLEGQASRLDRQRPTAVACAGGYRSSAAVSLLAKQDFLNLFNVVGGTGARVQSGYPVEGGGRTASHPGRIEDDASRGNS